MGLEGLEFACKHLVVGITADKYDVVKLAEDGHLVSVQCKPGVNAFFDYAAVRCSTQVLVMEYHVILDQHILEPALFQEQITLSCFICTITPSVIVAFCYEEMLGVQTVSLCYLLPYEVKEGAEVYFSAVTESLVDFCVVSSVDEYSDGFVLVYHGVQ